MGKTQELIKVINKLITEAAAGFDLATVSVGGRVDLQAMRCSEPFKNGRCGAECICGVWDWQRLWRR